MGSLGVGSCDRDTRRNRGFGDEGREISHGNLGRGVNERGTVKDRPVDSSGVSTDSPSPPCSPTAEPVSEMDELNDAVETVDIVNGVRVRLATGPSETETGVVSDPIARRW